jgi:hypothetical protein
VTPESTSPSTSNSRKHESSHLSGGAIAGVSCYTRSTCLTSLPLLSKEACCPPWFTRTRERSRASHESGYP